MLYHHGSLPYEVQLAQCAQKTRDSFEQILAKGEQELPKAITALEKVPEDTIVKANYLDFITIDKDKMFLSTIGIDGEQHEPEWAVHDHAWGQLCTKLEFPKAYGDRLRGTDWGRQLLERNIIDNLRALDTKRFLLRAIDGQVRGFLSDRYRRLDGRPILDSVFGLANSLGAVVISATVSDTKSEIKFAFPAILEPVKDEPMMFWVSIRWSDFGDSKVEISLGVTRAWCTNFAKADTLYGQVHLGKQLPDTIEFSQETYAKDTAFVVSATRDVFQDAFSEKRVHMLCERIKTAAETPAPKDIGAALRRHGLTKAEVEACETLYKLPDIEILPKGDTAWRFSNVISFMAKEAPPDRKLELEAIAGNVLILPPRPKLIEAKLVATA